MRLFTLLLLAGACGNRAEIPNAPQPSMRADRPAIDAGAPPHVITATHTNAVAVVAVTDDGKAAITSDDLGSVRFWPALDGLVEPVVIEARTPVSLALARASDGYVAALLDSARGIELLQLGPRGEIRGRRVVAAEPGFEDVVATSSAILARRSDQTIVRLDMPSQPLAPQAGEQILAIAARRDVAIAALADPEHAGEVREVRQIALARDLAWGAAYTLPAPLKAPIAISPSGRRIAGIDARSGAGTLVDLVGQPRVVAREVIGEPLDEETLLGFLDDERAVFRGGAVVGVPAVTAVADPWSATRPATRLRIGRDPAVADGVVISGHGTNLMLADPANTLFLGYRDLGVGYLRVTPNAITFSFGGRVVWLDDELRDRRARDLSNDATGGIPIDDHRLLKGMYSYIENDRSKLDVALVDAASGLEVQLGTWPRASSVTYDQDTRVLALTGYTTTISRALLDVENAKVTPLRPLKTYRDASVELFDPALADGVVAIATSYDDGAVVHEMFVDDQKSTTRPLAAAARTRVVNGVTLGFDRTGTIYTLQLKGDKATHVVVYRGGKEVKRWPVASDASPSGGTVDRAGTQILTFNATAMMLADAGGRERWRVPMWAVHAVGFTSDGSKVIVNTSGGLITLDAATGARIATACGWGFGLSTTEPSISAYNVPVVCAEEPPE